VVVEGLCRPGEPTLEERWMFRSPVLKASLFFDFLFRVSDVGAGFAIV